jgi:hypothetical protein
MNSKNVKILVALFAGLFSLIFMAGTAIATTQTTDPSAVITDTTSPGSEEVGSVKLVEVGNNTLTQGFFTITLPSNVKLANSMNESGVAGGSVTRNTTVLGTSASPNSLYMKRHNGTYGSMALVGFRWTADSFVSVLRVYASGDLAEGSDFSALKYTYGSEDPSVNAAGVKVADFASAATAQALPAAGGSSTSVVGQIYFNDTTSETVISLAGIANSATASDKLWLNSLFLTPATTNDTGTVNLTVSNGNAAGAGGIGVTDDAGVTVMTLTDQSAVVSGKASTASYPTVKAGAIGSQKIGRVKVNGVDTLGGNDSTLIFTLDAGAKFHADAADAADVKYNTGATGATDLSWDANDLAVNTSGQLIVTFDAGAPLTTDVDGDSGYATIPQSTDAIDASGVTTAGAITCTVTGTGDFLNVNQSVQVATSAIGGTTVAFVDNSSAGFTTLYAGRNEETLGSSEYVLLGETAPGSLLQGGTFTMALDQGAKFNSGTKVVVLAAHTTSPYTGSVLAITTPSTSKDSATISTTVGTKSISTKGAVKIGNQTTGWLDLTSATAGDLTMTFSGDSGVAAAGTVTVTFATIVNATTTTVANPETLVPGGTVTIPDITITENKFGSLVGSGVFGLKFPSTYDLDESVTSLTITTTPANGSASTTTVTGPTYEASNNIAFFNVTSASTSTGGLYTITISGLKAAISSTAGSGDATFVIGGSTSGTAYSSSAFGSNVGAKPYSETVKFGSIVSATVPFADTPVVGATMITQTNI